MALSQHGCIVVLHKKTHSLNPRARLHPVTTGRTGDIILRKQRQYIPSLHVSMYSIIGSFNALYTSGGKAFAVKLQIELSYLKSQHILPKPNKVTFVTNTYAGIYFVPVK